MINNCLIPLGSDFEEAVELIKESCFNEFYTGLKNDSIEQCSFSHHYSPHGSFSRVELGILFKTAQEYDKKINITLNTTWFSPAIKDIFIDDLKFLFQFPVGQIIVANLEIYKLIKTLFPNSKCSASSLFAIKSVASADFFYKLGFDRIVFPRNILLDEIRNIAETFSDKIELEIFVYGGGCNYCEGTCRLPHIFLGELQNDFSKDVPVKSPLALCKLPVEIKSYDKIIKPFFSLHQGIKNCGFCYIQDFKKMGIQYFKFTGRTMDKIKRKNVIMDFEKRVAFESPNDCELSKNMCLYNKERL